MGMNEKASLAKADSLSIPRCSHLPRDALKTRNPSGPQIRAEGADNGLLGLPMKGYMPHGLIEPALGTTLQCVALGWKKVLERGPRMITAATTTVSTH